MTSDYPSLPAPGSAPNTEHEDRLLWRSALGQATFELLSEGKEVTVETLSERLRRDEAAASTNLRVKAARAALAILAEQRH